ncbi:hypothetical protein AX15_000480 [Amanita polypyramis BW_CC]|nr:hypothetical protein AX15_000480 [Amanita polypyramis BW_CC]
MDPLDICPAFHFIHTLRPPASRPPVTPPLAPPISLMPFVEIDGPDGPWNFCYTITTPTKLSAETVDPDLPTVVFIHSVYTSKETFERQFDDPSLRQFNLVAFDLRGYGETGGIVTQDPYLPSYITDDVCDILDALKLPPCHIFGLSLGYYSSLDLAARRPEKILSVTICSPLPPTEPEEVLQGRLQVVKTFESFDRGKQEGRHQEFAEDTTLGAVQFMFNLMHSSILHAIVRLSWEYVLKVASISPDGAMKRTFRLFRDQVPLTKDHLAKVRLYMLRPIRNSYRGYPDSVSRYHYPLY